MYKVRFVLDDECFYQTEMPLVPVVGQRIKMQLYEELSGKTGPMSDRYPVDIWVGEVTNRINKTKPSSEYVIFLEERFATWAS